MTWDIKGPFDTEEKEGWVPQAFGDVGVFRIGKGVFGWDLAKNEKLWRMKLPADARYGNKQSTKCAGYYVTFSDIASRKEPGPVFAINPENGEMVWRTRVEAHCKGFERGVTASDEAVFYHGKYAPSEAWNLIKLDAATGEVVWQKPGRFADQVIYGDGRLFFGGGRKLLIMNDDGEKVRESDQVAAEGWRLTLGVDHTLLASYLHPKTKQWRLRLLDTRTLEVLGEMPDPTSRTYYKAGFQRGHFVALSDKKVILIDALGERHVGDRFTKPSPKPRSVSATPHGYAVLYNDDDTDTARFDLLDERTGDTRETLELDGRGTLSFWLESRLVAFYFEDLYVLTPD